MSASKNHFINGEEELIDGNIPKQDYIRLVIDSLQQLGYANAAKALEEESGILLEQPIVTKLKEAILQGKWDSAETLVKELSLPSSTTPAVLFLLRRQKYLEHLMSSQLSPALHVLRTELTPLAADQHALHALALLPLARSTEELVRRCNWPGSVAQARTALLYDLRTHIPPSMMIPHRRLHQLIKQAAELQTKKCVYHNTASAQLYLFEDHFCDRHELPSHAWHVLDQRDEVWYLQFSRKGKHFVSAGKDGRCLIWEVSSLNEEKPTRVLNHHHPISYVSWSPTDTHILTCSDTSVKVWSAQSGECHVSIKNTSKDAFTCCAWLNDSTNRFLIGGLDGKISLYSLSGSLLRQWTTSRINDLLVTADDSTLITATQNKCVQLWDLKAMLSEEQAMDVDGTSDERWVLHTIQENKPITSLALSRDNTALLVMFSSTTVPFVGVSQVQSISLYDIRTHKLIRKVSGLAQTTFVIRACFGGVGENFIVSGSEDSLIYLWHRQSGAILTKLSGHAGCVNCVAWSPADPQLFVSGSDDGSIRVWGRERKAIKRRREEMEVENGHENAQSNSGDDSNGQNTVTNGHTQ
jgi:WD40 repeat protein